MTTKELLDEYAGCYRVVDNCEGDGYGCKMCLEDRERMEEIEKDLEASIREEVVEDILYNFDEGDWMSPANASWTDENTTGYIVAKEEFEKFLKEYTLSNERP